MSLLSSLSVLTQGLDKLNPASVLTQGYPQTLKAPVAKSTTATPIVAAGTPVTAGAGRVAVIPDMPRVYDAAGNLVNPSSLPSIDLGSGQTRSLRPA
jgi:hypothetical protein